MTDDSLVRTVPNTGGSRTASPARQRLETPAAGGRFRIAWDSDALARGSERIARFLGTGRYLAIQTLVVVVWVLLNIFVLALRWDPYPFILLNLAFSTQAAYAAPLILLAQNRQDNRDRVSLEEDRLRAAQTKADTEFLARELAALRIAVGEVATRDYLRRELDEMREVLDRIAAAGGLSDTAAASASRHPARSGKPAKANRKKSAARTAAQPPVTEERAEDDLGNRPTTF